MTDAKRALWYLLRRKQIDGHRFRKQIPVGQHIVDFACLDARVIIELDGSQHAESSADAERDAWLHSQDFRVLRFWNNYVLTNPEGVFDVIQKALAAKV